MTRLARSTPDFRVFPLVIRGVLLLTLFGICVTLLLLPVSGGATEFTSPSFKVLDPVISVGGGRATSTAFQLEQSSGQPGIGISSSASFELRGGFLYFPAPAPAPAPASAPPPAPPPAGGGRALFPERLIFPAELLFPLLPPEIPVRCPLGVPATDLDCDGIIGLVDLSIFLYLNAVALPNPADFNRDTQIDIQDISILFTDWNERLLLFALEGPAGAFSERPGGMQTPGELAAIGEALTPQALGVTGAAPERPEFFRRALAFFQWILAEISSFIRLLFRWAAG